MFWILGLVFIAFCAFLYAAAIFIYAVFSFINERIDEAMEKEKMGKERQNNASAPAGV